MKRKQMMISFGAYDDDVYEFLQNNKNASALVRMLVRAYMRGENVSPTVSAPIPTPISNNQVSNIETVTTIEPEKINETISKVNENNSDYSKCNVEEVVTTRSEDKNRKKIQELDL